MIVLGIDPGTTRIGYAFLKKETLEPVEYGVIEIKKKELPEQLYELERKLEALIKKHKPHSMGVEKLFFAKNRKTALEVAHARGVIVMVAIKNKIEVCEFTPVFVKQSVTGYGQADKKAIIKMVSRLLGIHGLEKLPDDAADALAIAITAAVTKVDRV